jgi:tRNA(adenine34) deaminase
VVLAKKFYSTLYHNFSNNGEIKVSKFNSIRTFLSIGVITLQCSTVFAKEAPQATEQIKLSIGTDVEVLERVKQEIDVEVLKQKAIKEANKYPKTAFTERDDIYSLLAYAVVLKNWQDNKGAETSRGYNIGSVLVDETKSEVVFWARNAVNFTKNYTQHGEVRLMTCYLAENESNYLKNFTLYTTLEPCAMCSGMMYLTSLPRTVYGQKDLSYKDRHGYGDAIERLQLNSTALKEGFPPYPSSNHIQSDGSNIYHRYWLDSLYKAWIDLSSENTSITTFLTTSQAKTVFEDALQLLFSYEVKYPKNTKVIKQARDYYKNEVSDEYDALCLKQKVQAN